ncbi:MAG: ATP-binding protein [Aestuariibaculum sp.]
MFSVKHYIFPFLLIFSLYVTSQETVNNDPEIIKNDIKSHIQLAQNNLLNYDYDKAFESLAKAKTLAERVNDQPSIGKIYTLEGKIQFLLNENDKALKSLNKALEIQHNINDNANLGKTYKIFGDVYISKHDFNQALISYGEAKDKFESKKLNFELADILLCIGKAHFYLEAYNKALSAIEQALSLSKRDNLLITQSEALIYYGTIYHKLNDNKRALKNIHEGIAIAKTNKYPFILETGYLILSETYNNIEDFKVSREYLKKYVDIADSLRDLKHIYESKVYETEKRLDTQIKENQEMSARLKEADDKKSMDTLISILSVSLITILSLLTLSLYKNNNIRLKTNKVLQKKNTELLIAKERAELASKTKANFLSTVTHELRTPLYAVTGLSNMLLEEDPKPDQVPHLKSLKFSGDYLLTFINDILQINKIEANKVNLEPEPFNLKKKINNIILSLNNSAQSNNVKMHFEYEKGLPEYYVADQIKISQILINLLGNSIKFTKDGDIWIRIYQVHKNGKIYRLRFEVEDNGIGISSKKQQNMFESFSQGSIQINRKYGGTGLGLSIVKGLIDILNGEIHVKSKLGKGTMFYFEIPIEYTSTSKTNTSNKALLEKEKHNLDLNNVKLLVVEDNKINQMITKKILEKLKLQCDLSENGEDAVKLVKTNKYDIVLMDIHMPGISGIEATKIIRAFNKELPIFALTAVTIEDKIQEFKDAGFNDIIPKPFNQEEFELKVFRTLANKKRTISNSL